MSTKHPYTNSYKPPSQTGPTLVPPSSDIDSGNPAADLIRQKLAAIYDDEPNARQELAEAQLPNVQHSRHQRFMQSLNQSGRSASEIQTAWHQYYMELDDVEKRAVWQEFYDQSAQAKQQASRIQPRYSYQLDEPAQLPVAETAPSRPQAIYPEPVATEPNQFSEAVQAFQQPQCQPEAQPQPQPEMPKEVDMTLNPLLGGTPMVSSPQQDVVPVAEAADDRSTETIREQLRGRVRTRGALKVKHHLQSLLFGLGFGLLTIMVVLFGFFNEVVIAPFIQPSRNVSATPIIISPDGVTATDKNEVIIPKINVEIPLDFSATTIDEKDFESALDKGVAHYPTTALPGQKGNASFFGHSSNNIFNPGKYKFAFVLLNELVPGDTFYITYNGVAYGYTVFDKKIVPATEVSILNPVANKASTAMLVTCDPPGTSLNRLAVWGEQISPNPDSNTAAAAPATTTSDTKASTTALPGNGPTLWGRLRNWITGN
jgi:LPXTG-site transpeptidase (sortase) family protein